MSVKQSRSLPGMALCQFLFLLSVFGPFLGERLVTRLAFQNSAKAAKRRELSRASCGVHRTRMRITRALVNAARSFLIRRNSRPIRTCRARSSDPSQPLRLTFRGAGQDYLLRRTAGIAVGLLTLLTRNFFKDSTSFMNQKYLWQAIAVALFIGVGSLPAQNWIVSTAPSFNWKGVASSADGSKLVAVIGGQGARTGSIYVSTNSGASWQLTSAPSLWWQCVASSADGSKLVAGASGLTGAIYTSTNSGMTWTKTTAPAVSWSCASSSADGSKLVAAAGTFFTYTVGPLYTSGDGGATWISNNVPRAFWRGVASSADGSNLVAMPYGGNTYLPIYTSTNAGLTWTTNLLRSRSWSCVASSADGNKLAVGGDRERIYTSADAGATWVTNSAPSAYYQSIASSADGSTLVAVTDFNTTSTGPGPVYSSTNSGVTWITNTVSGVFWQSAASSADGSKLVAVGVSNIFNNFGGRIYVSPPEVLLTSTISSNNLVLSWTTNAIGFGLEQSPDLTMGSWIAVTNEPAITNGNKEVPLPTTNDHLFFRLKQ